MLDDYSRLEARRILFEVKRMLLPVWFPKVLEPGSIFSDLPMGLSQATLSPLHLVSAWVTLGSWHQVPWETSWISGSTNLNRWMFLRWCNGYPSAQSQFGLVRNKRFPHHPILPGLGQHAIVPKDGTVIVSQLAWRGHGDRRSVANLSGFDGEEWCSFGISSDAYCRDCRDCRV